MFRKVDHKNMGRANHGWLNTHFHFPLPITIILIT